MMVTTTPKKMGTLLKLFKQAGKQPEKYHITSAVAWENPEVSDAAVARVKEQFGSNLSAWKQEMEAELTEDDRALFRQSHFDKYRLSVSEAPGEYRQVVIGVDPATTSNERSDYSGIVVVGESMEKHSYVLEDCSLKGSPDEVTQAIASAFYRHSGDLVVVENNAAGDYFTTLMSQKDPYIPVRTVHAMKGKKVRAAHISHLNEIGRIHMVGEMDDFQALEEQLCAMNPDQDRDKIGDDRADAFVWALQYLVGRPAADWMQTYGFAACKSCDEGVNILRDKACRACGAPVIPDKQQEQAIGSGEKSAIRWFHAYVKKCPRHGNYSMKHATCPECGMGPETYLRQALSLSSAGTNPSWVRYSERNWTTGRKI
jgi:phage terminase large subunit-like protein